MQRGNDQHLFEEVAKDGSKDEGHGFVVKLTYAHMMEVSSKSWCDEAAAATGRPHGSHKLAVHHLAERVGTVIPAQQKPHNQTYSFHGIFSWEGRASKLTYSWEKQAKGVRGHGTPTEGDCGTTDRSEFRVSF